MIKMEVAIPPPTMDFDFNDARPLPFLSAPSTPKRIGDISLSAPTSPSRISEFYRRFDSWESNPATPKSPAGKSGTGGDDFAFDFRSELGETSLSAEELFDGGKIRPLKPPPRLQVEDQRSPLLSPRSPRSPIAQGKKIIREVFSPRKKNKDSDPFAIAAENTRRGRENDRGRERSPGLGFSSSRRATRSVSPYRVSEYPWEEEERRLQEVAAKQSQSAAPNSKPSSNSSSTTTTTKSSSRKWRLKDFLLFRSASEGRASDKDSKYPSFCRKPEDAKNTSFRSTDSSGSGTRRKGQVSAHELHYTTNKAASEDLKKKTFLPYKQGILGRLAFSPASRVNVAR